MLKDSFCSSPWYHIRIDPAGRYLPCRWSSSQEVTGYTVANTSITEFMNSDTMSKIRVNMLNGNTQTMCSACYYEDNKNKVNGRQKQLLKSAIRIENFDHTFCSSPHWDLFEYSFNNNGLTNSTPVDLQIDLGNTCNSACVMCSPTYSSKLSVEYTQLIKIEPSLFKKYGKFKNWTDDITLVNKFVDDLANLPNIEYIHFLGGETLYLKSFYTICNRLIELNLAKDISLGTTTNCTVYTPELEHIIRNFKQVHLGLSVEALHPVNDYIRYPSKHTQIALNIVKFLDLRRQHNLHISLRITPSALSVLHLDTLFEVMLNDKVTAESCNILHEPSCLRLELLPKTLLNQALTKINQLIQKYQLKDSDEKIINTRQDHLIDSVIAQVIFEYKYLLENVNYFDGVEQERYNLVNYLKAFEQLHNNNILDYLPEYEEFLRSYGY